MIYGIGMDVTEISRFNEWHAKSTKEQKRVFSDEEIKYCCAVPQKCAERFAVRYAAREAFYKAYQSACYMVAKKAPALAFLNVCQHIVIKKVDNGIPVCVVDWHALQKEQDIILPSDQMVVHVSLSHGQTTAHAMIVIASTK